MSQSFEFTPINAGKNRVSYPNLHDLQHQQVSEHLNQQRPWQYFLYWESDYQIKQGIEKLRGDPFITFNDPETREKRFLLLSQLYPQESEKSQNSFEKDVIYISAAVRQAREYYSASMVVSELTRPTLMFYSALALMRAATVALLGFDFLASQPKGGHGLSSKTPGCLLDGTETNDWPTNTTWQEHGDFVAFYHIARWDKYFEESFSKPSFHIIECLRQLGILQSGKTLQRADGRSNRLSELLWSYKKGQISPSTSEQIKETDCFEVPSVVTQFMVLFYFSNLARYHPITWQKLLSGELEEGFFFRLAMEKLSNQFIYSMRDLLPQPISFLPDPDTSQESHLPKPSKLQIPYRTTI